MAWRLADAKNRFSELVNRALTGNPQVVLQGTLPNGFYQGAVTKALISGDQGQALGTGSGGDQAVGGVGREVWREPVSPEQRFPR